MGVTGGVLMESQYSGTSMKWFSTMRDCCKHLGKEILLSSRRIYGRREISVRYYELNPQRETWIQRQVLCFISHLNRSRVGNKQCLKNCYLRI